MKSVAMEALSLKGKVKWWENLKRCLADFGWDDMRMESVKGMSMLQSKVHAKELCMEESDQVVGRGVGGAAKALCIK